MQLKLLDSLTDYLLISDLTLKADDHYGNVIRVEKFQSDMAIKAYAPGHSSTKWFLEQGARLRTVGAFYSLVLLTFILIVSLIPQLLSYLNILF